MSQYLTHGLLGVGSLNNNRRPLWLSQIDHLVMSLPGNGDGDGKGAVKTPKFVLGAFEVLTRHADALPNNLDEAYGKPLLLLCDRMAFLPTLAVSTTQILGVAAAGVSYFSPKLDRSREEQHSCLTAATSSPVSTIATRCPETARTSKITYTSLSQYSA